MLGRKLNTLTHKLLAPLLDAAGLVTRHTPKRELLAELYIAGVGLELGALNSPLKVPSRARVSYVDCATADELRAEYEGKPLQEPDIVDDAQTLATVADESQDFVIACHIIEHMEDPIGALKTWLRVVKPGGTLFIAIPDKRFTFDYHRDPTPFEHLRRDHEEGTSGSRAAHFEEMCRLVYGMTDEEEVRRTVERLSNSGSHTHFHVWTQIEMLEMAVRLRREMGLDFEVEAFCSYGNEGTLVLRKGERIDKESARRSLEEARGAPAVI